MSVRQRQEPIYQRPINSLEDLDRALNHNERVEQEIARHLQGSNLYKNAEQLPKNLGIVHLFPKAYWGSLGSATCQDIVNGLDQYQKLLTETVIVCNDKITPLFLRSLACHQKALQQYREPLQGAMAIASMTETGVIANEIAEEYEKTERAFLVLQGDTERSQLTLMTDRFWLIKKEKELIAQQNAASRNILHEKGPFLKRAILSLDKAINALWKIQYALMEVSFFWKTANALSGHLASPDLGDPDCVEIHDFIDELTQIDDTFQKRLKETEKEICIPLASDSPPMLPNLSDVIQSMKTGPDTLVSDTPTFFPAMLIPPCGIEKTFEKSYLDWLALAKINDTAINLMENVLVEARKTQKVIEEIESDPLAIALHAGAASSNN